MASNCIFRPTSTAIALILLYLATGPVKPLMGLGWLFATTAVLERSQSQTPAKELDLLIALNISDEMRGVSEVQGPLSDQPAWRLHTPFDNVQLPLGAALPELVTGSGIPPVQNISLHFIIRQQKKTIATLVSINSPGKMSPWFRLTCNLKNGGQHLVLFYRSVDDEKLHQMAFELPVHHHRNWTQIALTIAGDSAILFVDCSPPASAKLAGKVNLHFPPDSLMYFRQEPGFKKKFLGSVQIAKVLLSGIKDRPWKCEATSIRGTNSGW